MAKKHQKQHLTAERIQAFLDDSLSQDERDEVEGHSAFCGRCQAELEAWQLLYSELGGLAELSPASDFRNRVLDGLDEVVPAAPNEKRGFAWLRRRAVRAAEHVAPDRLQDYVEGLLPARQVASVATHLEGCGVCRTEETQWRNLIRGIEQLPAMAPSHAFAGRVMGQIQLGRLVRPVAARTARARALAWAARLVPKTQKAWAVVSGIALTPATVVALLTYAVFSNPLVTPLGLASFVWWKISDGTTALWGLLTDGLVESGAAYYAYSMLDVLAGAPAVATMVAVSFAAATSLAGWVLYRNLITARTVDGDHARVSV